MAGYHDCPSVPCVVMDQGRVDVHKQAKKEQGQYPAILTKQACSTKNSWLWRNSSRGSQCVALSVQDSANQSTGFGSSRSPTELAMKVVMCSQMFLDWLSKKTAGTSLVPDYISFITDIVS